MTNEEHEAKLADIKQLFLTKPTLFINCKSAAKATEITAEAAKDEKPGTLEMVMVMALGSFLLDLEKGGAIKIL